MGEREHDEDIQERLVEASRLSTLGRLLPSVLHQMSTPLGAVALRAESLGHEVDDAARRLDAEKRRRYLRSMVEETRRCQDLLATVREFASPGEPAATTFDLAAMCRSAGLLLGHEAMRRQVGLLVEGAEVAAVKAQKQRLAQAVLALVLNALDASPRGGRVRVTVERRTDEITVAVEDEGEGVPESVRRRLFEPFTSSRTPERGLGLGLMACRVVAEAHGGSIGEEGSGRGSRFVLHLPVEQQTHAAA